MRNVASAVAILACVSTGVCQAAEAPAPPRPGSPTQGLTARSSPSAAGRRPAILTLTLRYSMQCGRPSAVPIVIVLPAALRLPRSVPTGAISLGGRAVAGVSVNGNALRVSPKPRHGVICNVIGPAAVTLVIGRAADLGNPVVPGVYPVSVDIGALALHASLRITAG